MQKHARNLIQLITDVTGSNPTTGCEVGVWLGQTSRELLTAFPNLTLLMVDRYASYDVEHEKKADRQLGRLNQQAMDKAMVTAYQATVEFADRRLFLIGNSMRSTLIVRNVMLDFVFIDANHAYESVRIDLDVWWEKVRPGGLVCGHDYRGRGRKAGVKRAVDEFASECGYNVETRPGLIWWFIK